LKSEKLKGKQSADFKAKGENIYLIGS